MLMTPRHMQGVHLGASFTFPNLTYRYCSALLSPPTYFHSSSRPSTQAVRDMSAGDEVTLAYVTELSVAEARQLHEMRGEAAAGQAGTRCGYR